VKLFHVRLAFGLLGVGAFLVPAHAVTRYVAGNGGHVPPFTNWTTAATSIQAAVNSATNGDWILVTNGVYGGNVLISNKTISLVSMYLYSGAISDAESTVILGTGSGGAVRIVNGVGTSGRFMGFTITNGYANGSSTGEYDRGGGVYVAASGPRLEALRIRGNRATSTGGGLYLEHATSVVNNVVVENNQSSGGSAGAGFYYGKPSLENLVVRDNVASSSDGGGILFYHCNATCRNMLVVNNSTTEDGGGMHFDDSDVLLENTTVYGNRARTGGGLNISYSSSPRLVNSIVWSNTPDNIGFCTQWFGMDIRVDYSDVQGGSNGVVTYGKGPVYWGAGNLDSDPMFDAGDFQLLDGSPCVNAGDNRDWMTGAADLAGAPRIAGPKVDLGAYENPNGASVPTVSVPATPAGPASGLAGPSLAYVTGGSTSSLGGGVEYRFDWGDGNLSGWDANTEAAHAWSATGLFAVAAQARSAVSADVVSAWSGALPVWITNAPPVPDDHYVALTGSDEYPYTNWAMAANRVQDAVDAATHGDTVWVTNGTYEGNVRFNGKNIRVTSLFTVSGDAADIETTVLQGIGSGSVVRITSGETVDSALIGFTVTGGYADGPADGEYDRGGGVCVRFSRPRLEHLRIVGNRATSTGGGLYLEHATSVVNNVVVENNQSSGGSAGAGFYYGKPSLENLVVRDNVASSSDGGGILFYHCNATCRNMLVVNNSTTEDGGGMHFDDSDVLLENTTVYGNRARTGGGLNISYSSSPRLVNSIVWSNTPDNIGFCTQWFGMDIRVDYSDVQGGSNGVVTYGKGPVYWGAGNLDSDPMFDAGDFQLLDGSPCVNAGDNRDWMTGAADLAGAPRIAGPKVDLGAYENPNGASVPTVSVPATPAGPASGLAGPSLAYVTGGSTSSLGGGVEYRFDWGDGNLSGWDANTEAAHAWSATGLFAVAAQARSAVSADVVSAWSGALPVWITNAPPVPDDHYVALTGSDEYPYTNWAMAAGSIQAAIGAAEDGDTVWVASAEYRENIDFTGKNIRIVSLFELTGDPADIAGTIIRGTGTGNVVRAVSGESTNALLKGFTIVNGHAVGVHPFNRGGGILCQYGSPRIEHVRVTGNHADIVGGGIYLEHSASALRDVEVAHNTAGGGGGMGCYYGQPSLVNVCLQSNTATQSDGGGMILYHASPLMRNVLVADNTAPAKAGGIHFDAANPVMENLTVVSNSAAHGGGLNVSYSSAPVLRNSIIWGNSPQQVEFDDWWFAMALTVEYSDLQGGLAAIETHGLGPVHWLDGNISADPVFGDANGRLSGISPCLNTGLAQPWMAAETDLDGQPRVCGASVDMGAFEYSSAAMPVGSLRCVMEPSAVLPLGARWRVPEGPHTNWNESGEVLHNLATGEYTIVFSEVAGWTKPADAHPVVVEGLETLETGLYLSMAPDTGPPVIVSVEPPSGFVTTTNHLDMLITVTDNVAVARVTVNKHDATCVGGDQWAYTVHGVRGAYHVVEIVAYDTAGNVASGEVVYAREHGITLHPVWAGYWRIRNPFSVSYSYRWEAVETAETGSGVLVPHGDTYFTTSPQVEHVQLYVDEVLIETKEASEAEFPAPPSDERFIDSDGDGLLNMEEDAADTDPFSPDSHFMASLLSPDGAAPQPERLARQAVGSDFSLAWPSSADNLYTVEISLDLWDWAAVPGYTDKPGTGSTMSYTNASAAALFFRLKTQPAEPEP